MLTLAIIKPDAVKRSLAGKIVAHLEAAGFAVRAARLVKLSNAQAEAFYEVHRDRPFYRSLVTFMTSGPGLALALERDDAVTRLREVIGATDPAEAKPGDRKSTRLNSSHSQISYAVFCLKIKTNGLKCKYPLPYVHTVVNPHT